jgi:adenine/guanine/hypoxanthine permease
VLAPILIFVALDIMAQAYLACPARHAPAVAFAHFPTVARLLSIKLGNPAIVPAEHFRALLTAPGKELPEALVTLAVGNGFILTAMLWGGFLAELIDRRLPRSALYLGILAVFTFFGVVHSASPDGNMYLPWTLADAQPRVIPYQFALGYLVLAVLFLLLGLTRESREDPPASVEHPGGGG